VESERHNWFSTVTEKKDNTELLTKNVSLRTPDPGSVTVHASYPGRPTIFCVKGHHKSYCVLVGGSHK